VTDAGENVVLLVGAGAVIDCWKPVIRALRRIGFHDVRTPEGATFAMARLVYGARMAWLRPDKALDKERPQFLARLSECRAAISKELLAAETADELKVRPEFGELIVRIPDGPDHPFRS
jgi:hypothetical protein